MSYHQLTEAERYQIEFLRSRGKTYAEIAKELGRHRSTIQREVKRNSLELYDEKFENVVDWPSGSGDLLM